MILDTHDCIFHFLFKARPLAIKYSAGNPTLRGFPLSKLFKLSQIKVLGTLERSISSASSQRKIKIRKREK